MCGSDVSVVTGCGSVTMRPGCVRGQWCGANIFYPPYSWDFTITEVQVTLLSAGKECHREHVRTGWGSTRDTK